MRKGWKKGGRRMGEGCEKDGRKMGEGWKKYGRKMGEGCGGSPFICHKRNQPIGDMNSNKKI